MARIRRLPSGKWNARVHRNGRHVDSYTHPLESVVKRWARDVERQLDAGEWAPKVAEERVTVAEFQEQWQRTARLVAQTTAAKNASQWRTHVRPKWGQAAMQDVTRDDVRAWVKEMHTAGVGAHTIQACVHYLGAIFAAWLDGSGVNPAHGVKFPPVELKTPFF